MKRNNRAATVIEVSICLPLFLLLLTTGIDLAMLVYTRIAATSAITNAARLGITRGDSTLTGTGLISSIHELAEDYDNGYELNSYPLFTHGDTQFGRDEIESYLGPDFGLAQANLQKLYALAMMNESIRIGMGGLVRFPCDGPGCMNCKSAELISNISLQLQCVIETKAFLPSLLTILAPSGQTSLRRIQVSTIVNLPERY